MLYNLIVCRSLTYAQRTAAVLKQAGVTAWLVRTPRELSKNGCGYSVKVLNRSLDRTLEVLRTNRLDAKALYAIGPTGEYQEVGL